MHIGVVRPCLDTSVWQIIVNSGCHDPGSIFFAAIDGWAHGWLGYKSEKVGI